MRRAGFTLVELLIVTTLTGLLGVALVRILISDSRFVASQGAMLDARQAGRAAMNSMTVDLRLVGPSGLRAADRDSVVVVIPYAFGMACRTVSNTVIASLMPADSLSYASGTPDTMAVRDPNTGTYTFTQLTAVAASTDEASCTADSIRIVPEGSLVGITGIPNPNRPASGDLFYLGRTIRYKFAASGELPGRRALWRKEGSAAYEEIVVPFDTSAKFAFLVGPSLSVQASPPADLSTVRGLELHLIAQSETTTPGRPEPEKFQLITRVPFLNVVN